MEVIVERPAGVTSHNASVIAGCASLASGDAGRSACSDTRRLRPGCGAVGLTCRAPRDVGRDGSAGNYWKPVVLHEALFARVDGRVHRAARRGRSLEAGCSLSPEARGRVGAALTTTRWAGTARRLGFGK
jgi:hypothetical protein